MDFGVRPRDKTPKLGVAHCKLFPSQESENEQIQIKSMLICFLDSLGIVHKEFVPPEQTVNQTFYREVLDSEKGWHVCDQALHTFGCCTMTTPHVTWQSPSRNFWQKKYSCGSSAPLFARSQSLRLIFIPLAQKQLERAPFWYFG